MLLAHSSIQKYHTEPIEIEAQLNARICADFLPSTHHSFAPINIVEDNARDIFMLKEHFEIAKSGFFRVISIYINQLA
jgi:hypothetical protein